MSDYFFPTAFLIFEAAAIAITRLLVAFVDWKYRDYDENSLEEVTA